MEHYNNQQRIIIILGFIVFHLLVLSSAQQSDIADFVIVGGGVSGCVLASRLTESGSHSVLLLEAGGVPHSNLEIPAVSAGIIMEYVRMYQTVPQEHAGLSNNGIVNTLVGRSLGGGSSVNAMIWNRGNPVDIDAWANITSDPSWSYDKMLKYFKKVERYAGDFPSDHHGNSGPITVSRPKYSPGLQEWLDAGKSLGFEVADPNGPQKVSFTPLEFSKLRGRRQSAYTAYLKPAMSRSNLRVITSAEATQILFNGSIAAGVKYRVNGTEERLAFARKEFIISAGTFETAALLMRSGIGPKDVLQNARIPQIHELPVGANLHDHPLVAMEFIVNNKSVTFDPETDLNPENFKIYNQTGDGPYSAWGGGFGQALLKSSETQPSPDIQIYWVAGATGVPTVSRRASLKAGEVFVSSFVVLGLPKSRGSVILDPKNPKGLPLVDFKYFSAPADMEVMIGGVRAALNIYENSPPFKKLGARYHPGSSEACNGTHFGSDDYWRCVIRQVATYGAHGVGTCRMGRGPEDQGAVVDASLRIIGLHKIRIVDASVMPTITNVNVQAPVYAIAEKGAVMILKTWK